MLKQKSNEYYYYPNLPVDNSEKQTQNFNYGKWKFANIWWVLPYPNKIRKVKPDFNANQMSVAKFSCISMVIIYRSLEITKNRMSKPESKNSDYRTDFLSKSSE